MRATRCTFEGCARTTRHASVRCHDHRGAARATATATRTPPPPLPPAPAVPPFIEEFRGVRVQRWREENGYTHRIGGPAAIYLGRNAEWVEREEWLEHAKKHRVDGPASIAYRPNGAVRGEEWHFRGKPHRVGGPARTAYRPDGSVAEEVYIVDGGLHRVDGPARVEIPPSGVRNEFYYLGGDPIPKKEFGAALLRADNAYLLREFEASSYSILLDEGADPRAIAQAVAAGVSTVDGIRQVLDGAPAEWVAAYEEGSR